MHGALYFLYVYVEKNYNEIFLICHIFKPLLRDFDRLFFSFP
jgi:hypothetical protein